ncbi:hypothetical protein ACOSQ4_026964 [Xanthoceras sorbifolium]
MDESRTVCFITDRQKGITAALEQCWPRYILRYCGRHILQNLMAIYKIDYLRDLFWPATRSHNAADFVAAMGNVRETSEEAYNYLAKIPAKQWSVHAFDTFCKAEHTTNNVVEAFNGWLVKYRAL